MPREIEHRYLLRTLPAHRGELPHDKIKQGYLNLDPHKTERVRIKGDKAFYTMKSQRVNGVVEKEDEREISMDEALAYLEQCHKDHILEKTRYYSTEVDGHLWEIDVFGGKLDGLVIAEIELLDVDERYRKPIWLDGPNITNDNRLSNASLVSMTRNQVIKIVRAWLNTHEKLNPSLS